MGMRRTARSSRAASLARLLTDGDAAARQAVEVADRGITSICIHSDTPGAAELGAAVAVGLLQAGFELRAFTR